MIEQILNEEYGAGLGIYNPTSILWASELAADKIGVEATKRELREINKMREGKGLPVAVHSYGHRLF